MLLILGYCFLDSPLSITLHGSRLLCEESLWGESIGLVSYLEEAELRESHRSYLLSQRKLSFLFSGMFQIMYV